MEHMGKEPNIETLNLINGSIFPEEVTLSLYLYSLLSDRWDGASGSYMGKDYTDLQLLFNIYEVEAPKIMITFIKAIDIIRTKIINKDLKRKHDAEMRSAKQGVKTPIIPRKHG